MTKIRHNQTLSVRRHAFDPHALPAQSGEIAVRRCADLARVIDLDRGDATLCADEA